MASSVNYMHWSMELMCSRNPLLCTVLMTTKVSSTYLFHRHWGWGDVLRVLTLKSSIYRLATMGIMSKCMEASSSCTHYLPWNKEYVFLKLNSNRQMMLFTVMDVLCWSTLSCSIWSWMILMTGPMATDMKSAITSHDMIHSSCLNWISLICCTMSLLLLTWCGDLPTRGFRILASSLDVS